MQMFKNNNKNNVDLKVSYGSKSAGREKSALSVTNEASLGESPFPSHPSYSWNSIVGAPAQEFSPSWTARKRMQERVEIS